VIKKPNITRLPNGQYHIDWGAADFDGEDEDDFFTYGYNAPKTVECDCGAVKVYGPKCFKREHAHWCEILKEDE